MPWAPTGFTVRQLERRTGVAVAFNVAEVKRQHNAFSMIGQNRACAGDSRRGRKAGPSSGPDPGLMEAGRTVY